MLSSYIDLKRLGVSETVFLVFSIFSIYIYLGFFPDCMNGLYENLKNFCQFLHRVPSNFSRESCLSENCVKIYQNQSGFCSNRNLETSKLVTKLECFTLNSDGENQNRLYSVIHKI